MQINNIIFCKGNEIYSRKHTTVIKHSDITRFAICIFKILAERKVNIFIPFTIYTSMSFYIATLLFEKLVDRNSFFSALRNVFSI